MTTQRYYRLSAKIWLFLAFILFGLWFLLWLGVDKTTKIEKKSQKIGAEVILPNSITDNLLELRVEVAPVKFDAIARDMRTYPSEFKDKDFFKKNKNAWSVSVMDVGEHKLILDYLDTRADSEKFAYFRYTDIHGKEKFFLTYGVFSSFQEAMGALKMVDFGLPQTVKSVPESMDRYLDMIDDYSRPDDASVPVVPTMSKKQPVVIEEELFEPEEIFEQSDVALTQEERPQSATKEKPPQTEKTPKDKSESAKIANPVSPTPHTPVTPNLPVPPTIVINPDDLPPPPAFNESGQ